MADTPADPNLNFEEQRTRIQQMIADIERKRQEVSLAPWQLAIAGMTAGAALFAAGAAFVKVIG